MSEHSPPTARLIRFGAFELDPKAGELRKSGMKTRLPEQSLQLLMLLLQQPGEVVTREEMRKRLWPNGTFVDFDHSLNAAMKRLREALDDSADNARFVETLPRHGYRFIYPVDVGAIHESPLPDTVAPVAPVFPPAADVGAGLAPPTRAPQAASLRRRIIAATGALLAIVAALLALNVGGLRDRFMRRAAAVPKIGSMAVLPLENLSGDPEQEYFADGMTEELITNLGKISALRVISRTSVMQYKGTKKPLPQIARELNVDALVEGAVLRSGDRVRITAQLIQARPEKHLWAESYERDLRDILALQGEVAQDITREIKIGVAPEEHSRLTHARPVNPGAYEDYLRGRYFWDTRTEKGVRKSLEYYQQALKVDPGYAPAYAGMAASFMVLANRSFDPPHEAWGKVKDNALKALELDEALAEAHTAWAVYNYGYAHDWTTMEKEYLRAIQLNPGYATAHLWYGQCIATFGRLDEALEEIKRAQELDPLSRITNNGLGRILYLVRRYDDAILQFRKTIELDPSLALAHWALGTVHQQKGLFKEAVEEFRKAVELSGSAPYYVGVLGGAYAVAGRKSEAVAMLRTLEKQSKHQYVTPHAFAEVYAGLGDKDRAILLYEKAFDERSIWLGQVYFKVDPRFDSWRSDPRFQDLLRRMNFPP
jgi:TolB-like protein/DNA-binding winged helix-turn-helix (wHTH) protein/tetratricopeptide (TPR) repeat protein